MNGKMKLCSAALVASLSTFSLDAEANFSGQATTIPTWTGTRLRPITFGFTMQ